MLWPFSALKLLLGLVSRFLGSKDGFVNSFSIILNHWVPLPASALATHVEPKPDEWLKRELL
jgi:hypothetical protein